VSGSYLNPPLLGMTLNKNVLKNIGGEITDGILLNGDAQKIKVVVTQFKILNLNFRYRHNSAPNVKVLAARLGTKGKRKYSGSETGSRGWLKAVGHFCLVFRNEQTLRRAIQYSKNL
jgi:hypothetical protein